LVSPFVSWENNSPGLCGNRYNLAIFGLRVNYQRLYWRVYFALTPDPSSKMGEGEIGKRMGSGLVFMNYLHYQA
jgi:hypothetical protein